MVRGLKIIQGKFVLGLCSLRASYPSFFTCEEAEKPVCGLTFVKTEL